MSRGATFILLGAFGLIASLLPNRATAYCRMTTETEAQVGDAPCIEEGEPLFWKNTCLSYAIDSRGSQWMTNEEVEEAIDLAFETWENVDCSGAPPNVVFKSIGSSVCQRPEFNDSGNVNTIAFLDPWRDPCSEPSDLGFEPRAFAITVVWRDGKTGEIFDADLLINDELATPSSAGGPYANCPDTGCPEGSGSTPGPADLRNVVTHEIGHFIGLGHSDVVDATMYSETDRTSVSLRTLALDDIDAVCDIYPPGNLDQLCDATPIGGLRLDCEVDDQGEPFVCDGPGSPPGSGGGCSAGPAPGGSSWATVLAFFFALVLVRRIRGDLKHATSTLAGRARIDALDRSAF